MSELRYDFGFTWTSTYARAARLIASSVRSGTVVDLGAGVGSQAEPLDHFGFGYIGLDVDPANVEAMRERGRSAAVVDLTGDDVVDRVIAALSDLGLSDDEPIAAVTMLDVVEHLPDPARVLGVVRTLVERLATRRPDEAPLFVVSIPNVAHLDIAAKLLGGRWDVTDVGLLDDTHITLFDEARLEREMHHAGFAECGRSDVVYPVTEQRFPVDLPGQGETTLAAFLRDLHLRGTTAGETYQFVRAYRVLPGVDEAPGLGTSAAPEADDAVEAVEPAPFLSVVVRTRGDRSSLTDTLTALAAQDDDDLEVLLMVHAPDDAAGDEALAAVTPTVAAYPGRFRDRVHVHRVVGGGRSRPLNEALAVARGRYLGVLDDDDVVTGDWVGAFRRAAEREPGRIVRSRCVVQWMDEAANGVADFAAVSGFEAPYPDDFDLLDHIRANRSPTCSYAVPMEAVRTLGARYDEDLRVCEDWGFLLDLARFVGVAGDDAVTSVYRRWRGDGGSAGAEAERVWIDDHWKVVADLDTTPTLVPAGSLARIHRLYEYVERLERELGRRGDDDLPYRS